MDIKLKVFCTVAETKSFTKTSRIVHLSQPAVSLQIQALEEFFETKLFDKTGKQVSLTVAGKILYEHATHIMGHYNEVVKEINKLTGTMKGTERPCTDLLKKTPSLSCRQGTDPLYKELCL